MNTLEIHSQQPIVNDLGLGYTKPDRNNISVNLQIIITHCGEMLLNITGSKGRHVRWLFIFKDDKVRIWGHLMLTLIYRNRKTNSA